MVPTKRNSFPDCLLDGICWVGMGVQTPLISGTVMSRMEGVSGSVATRTGNVTGSVWKHARAPGAQPPLLPIREPRDGRVNSMTSSTRTLSAVAPFSRSSTSPGSNRTSLPTRAPCFAWNNAQRRTSHWSYMKSVMRSFEDEVRTVARSSRRPSPSLKQSWSRPRSASWDWEVSHRTHHGAICSAPLKVTWLAPQRTQSFQDSPSPSR